MNRLSLKRFSRLFCVFMATLILALQVMAPMVAYAQEAPPEDPGVGSEYEDKVKCYDEDYISVLSVDTGLPKNPIKWFTCSVAAGLASAIDWINLMTQRMLLFDPTRDDTEAETFYADCVRLTGDDSCANTTGLASGGTNQLRKVWGTMLSIANILLVLAFLVMVLSTALDLGLFSNYTIKKMLPRIIIAAVFANLSWSVCSLIISTINFIGIGLQDFLTAPFLGQLNQSVQSLSEGALSETVVANGAMIAALGYVIFMILSTGGFFLLFLLAIALVAALVAMLIILVRRIALILLVTFSPIAFMLWAFPGGDSGFKKWWRWFMQMALVFPFAMLLFSGGIIVAALMSSTGAGNATGTEGVDELITAAIIVTSLIAPYALLPATFKMAGGTLGKLTGMANDKGKGLIDRAKNGRGYKAKAERKKERADAGAAKRAFVRGRKRSEEGKGKIRSFTARRRQGATYGRQRGVGSGLNQVLASEAADKHNKQAEAVEKVKLQKQIRDTPGSQRTDQLVKAGLDGAKSGNVSQLKMAFDVLMDLGDVKGIEQLQDAVISQMGSSLPGRQERAAVAIDDQLGARYGDVKGSAAHLTAGVRNDNGTIMTTPEVQAARVDTFVKQSSEVLAGQKEDSWKSVAATADSVGGASEVAKVTQSLDRVVQNDKLANSIPPAMVVEPGQTPGTNPKTGLPKTGKSSDAGVATGGANTSTDPAGNPVRVGFIPDPS